MAGTRKQDQQARDGWRLNGRKRPDTQTVGFTSPNGAKGEERAPASPAVASVERTAKPERLEAEPRADASAFAEASTYLDASYADLSGGVARGGAGSAAGLDGRIYGGAMAPVDPYAAAYADPYAGPEFDDTVLGGLHYRTAAPRQPVGDIEWAGALRRFARVTIWCLPAAVLTLALASVFGWPTPTSETSGASPGTWLVLNLLGLGLWLAGVVGLAALAASTALRLWGLVAVTATIAGTVLVAPVLGILGLARPAVIRTAEVIGPEPAGSLQAQFLDGALGRWLVILGFALLALGAIAVAGTILGSRVLSRIDGWLVVGSIAVAVVAAYLSWEFMLTLAAMVMLAATLGLAWTVSRLSPDGSLTGAD